MVRTRAGNDVGMTVLPPEYKDFVYESIKSEDLPKKQGNEYFNITRKVREQLSAAQRDPSTVSEIYKETLRAMLSSFSQFYYINSENEAKKVKCIFANPERPIAKQFQENNIILPIISVSQVSTEEDNKRVRYKTSLVHEKYWDEDNQRAVRIVSIPSKPAKFKYEVNLWCKYRADLDQLLEQIRLAFSPDLLLTTKYSNNTKAFIESETDFGDDQVDDKQDRLIKKSLTIMVDTYIPSPKYLMTSTGKVTMIKTELYIDGAD